MSRRLINAERDAPSGYDKLLPTLLEFERRLNEIHNEKTSKLSTRSSEKLWKIIQLNHERSHYIYKLFYKRKLITPELYKYLIKQKLGDVRLINRWRKKGYEKLCCLQCIHVDDTLHGKTCICRVPRWQLEQEAEKKGKTVEFKQCIHCGCHGCASTD